VTGIECRHRIAEMRCRATNQQVFERFADAMSSQLPFKLSSWLGNFERHRMNWHVPKEFITE